MKTILIICDSLEEKGGVEKIVTLQANHYIASGFSVYILTRYKIFKNIAYELNDRINVISYSWDMKSFGLKKIINFNGFIKWIKKQVNLIDPDVIQTHGLNVGVLSIIGANKKRNKIIACDHNHYENANKLWSLLRKITYKKINTVISLTKEDLPKFLSINPNSICIYNPVSLNNIKFGYSKNKIALAIGRYTKQKGFDILIDAWHIVHNYHPDWKLKIVGDGEEKSAYEKKIYDYGLSEIIELCPPKSNIIEEYNNSNVFILSSRYEGFCLVLIEAMTVGLPVISFACKTGPKEVVINGSGILVEPENKNELAKTIVRFIESPESWDEISLLARENAKRFTVEQYFKEWDEIIYGIAQR